MQQNDRAAMSPPFHSAFAACPCVFHLSYVPPFPMFKYLFGRAAGEAERDRKAKAKVATEITLGKQSNAQLRDRCL